jgi:hypothetical protein
MAANLRMQYESLVSGGERKPAPGRAAEGAGGGRRKSKPRRLLQQRARQAAGSSAV